MMFPVTQTFIPLNKFMCTFPVVLETHTTVILAGLQIRHCSVLDVKFFYLPFFLEVSSAKLKCCITRVSNSLPPGSRQIQY